MSKLKTSFALTEEALNLLHALATHLGVTRNSALEIVIRDRAKRERISSPVTPKPRKFKD